MKYFNLYPTITYSFPGNNSIPVTNIFIRQEINVIDNSGYNLKGNEYIVEDGKSPDAIARDAYENPNLFWYVLTVNKIYDFYKQWPVSHDRWVKELDRVNSKYTFFTPFNMSIEKGDIVSKYREIGNFPFDINNYGVVIDFDPYMRSFDVDIIKGDMNEGDKIIILRSDGIKSYNIVHTSTGSLGQTLIRKDLKLNSCVGFMLPDKNSKEPVFVSPYSNYGLTGSVSDQTQDLTGTDCILDLYIRNVLPEKVSVISFQEESQKDWIFKKVLNIIPRKYVGQIQDIYISNLTQQ